MPLHETGFLGAHNQQWSKVHQEKHKEIFGHLREVNQLCHEYLRDLTINNKNGREVFATAYFARGLTCFQSIVALGERGFTDDIRAICRALVQIFFRLAALSKDPRVINRLVASAESRRRQRASLFQAGDVKLPPNVAAVDWNAKIAELDAALDKIGRSEANDKELATIGDCLEEYYTAYALMSDAAHASVADLEASVEFDKDFNVVGFKYGPHDRQFAAYVLYAALLQLKNLLFTDQIIRQSLLDRTGELLEQNASLARTPGNLFTE
jgi:hypothetical protein